MSLLEYAIDVTPNGGRIEVAALIELRDVVVRVRYDGREVDVRVLNGACDLFASPDPSEKGATIGLVLARTLVRLQGGTLDVTGRGAGVGAEFVMRLPLFSPG